MIIYDMKERVVLDTDVIIAALRSPTGASAALLSKVVDRHITMLASVTLFFEYEAKCSLADHWRAGGLNKEQAEVFISGLAALIEPVETHFLWRPLLRDPNDEMVLEVAVNGRAESIITFNFRDYGQVPKTFGLDVLTPSDALRRFNHG